jgi:hypothetical protein
LLGTVNSLTDSLKNVTDSQSLTQLMYGLSIQGLQDKISSFEMKVKDLEAKIISNDRLIINLENRIHNYEHEVQTLNESI